MSQLELNKPGEARSGIFYGYILVGLCFFIMMTSFGTMDSFGVFVKPLLGDFGWTRATTSAAYSISFLVFGFVGILMGGLTDRFGPRAILTFCGVCLGAGYFLMSQLESLWQLYLFEGVIIGVGMSALYAPVLSLIARWFIDKRGLMTGIALSGMGIGQLVAPPVISRLIEFNGWRDAYIFTAVAVLLVVVIVTQFLRHDPAKMGLQPYRVNSYASNESHDAMPAGYSLREAAATMQFWVLVVLKLCFGYYMFSILVHIVPHATDLGISSVSAANILAVGGLAMVVGSFTLGRVADKIGPKRVYILCFLLACAALLWLLVASEMWALCLFAVFFGLANGGNTTADSLLIARLFGLNAIGAIVGVSSCAFAIGAALGPVFTGYIFDSSGSYVTAFIVCAAFSVAGLVMSALEKPTEKLQASI